MLDYGPYQSDLTTSWSLYGCYKLHRDPSRDCLVGRQAQNPSKPATMFLSYPEICHLVRDHLEIPIYNTDRPLDHHVTREYVI